jgi:general stress protein YciG
MDPEERREIARRGGDSSHEYGRAHEWDSEEAGEAGHRGGLARWSEDERDYGRGRSYRSPSVGRSRYEDRPMSREEAGRSDEEDDDRSYRTNVRRTRSDYDEDDDRDFRTSVGYRGRESYEDDDDDRPMSRKEARRRGASYEDDED